MRTNMKTNTEEGNEDLKDHLNSSKDGHYEE